MGLENSLFQAVPFLLRLLELCSSEGVCRENDPSPANPPSAPSKSRDTRESGLKVCQAGRSLWDHEHEDVVSSLWCVCGEAASQEIQGHGNSVLPLLCSQH